MPAYDMSGEMDHNLAHIAGRMQPRTTCERCRVLEVELADATHIIEIQADTIASLKTDLSLARGLINIAARQLGVDIDALANGFDETGE
jgi:hypothetical protein